MMKVKNNLESQSAHTHLWSQFPKKVTLISLFLFCSGCTSDFLLPFKVLNPVSPPVHTEEPLEPAATENVENTVPTTVQIPEEPQQPSSQIILPQPEEPKLASPQTILPQNEINSCSTMKGFHIQKREGEEQIESHKSCIKKQENKQSEYNKY